ncbi:sure-like protein [Cantharellus anzutake]|uniref:sure-like protein n=1 Tax=Cantharellus anzutake TaxID=1750568 RepID=UPI0019070619|nr:sure-like protein [Cantharellus anzutake]KAF8337397.1 sure-like protein [Cantharellus anzutake]
MAPIRVLLTNDDGPPSRDSPFILGLFVYLCTRGSALNPVVLPSSQKSWIGKAYHIKEKIYGRYYYPLILHSDARSEVSDASRPLKEGELGEWILLDATPATCANIAIHNIFPGEIDLVISGPNFGRNTSSAFVLSSGTVGAAMSSSLSLIRSIALSYGVFTRHFPTDYVQPSHELSLKIIGKLWNQWGKDPSGLRNGEVDLYNVNIPLVPEILREGGMEVAWTRIWRNSYTSLFQPQDSETSTMPAGPDARVVAKNSSSSQEQNQVVSAPDLAFKFSPQMSPLVDPPISSLPYGTDAWAVHHAKASVTPLRTSFAEPGSDSMVLVGESFDNSPSVGEAGRAFKL